MSKYTIYGISFTGEISISFNNEGLLQIIDYSKATLDQRQLEQYIRSLPITEQDFVNRADRSNANYKKEE